MGGRRRSGVGESAAEAAASEEFQVGGLPSSSRSPL